MKDTTKAYLAFAVIAAVIAGLALGIVALRSNSAPKPTVVQKFQALINKTKTAEVASATVVRCEKGNSNGIEVYGCAVNVLMKNGTGGCAGVIVQDLGTTVKAVEAPASIDPKYCAAG